MRQHEPVFVRADPDLNEDEDKKVMIHVACVREKKCS